MRGMDIFQKPYYREISTMRGRTMRGLPVPTYLPICTSLILDIQLYKCSVVFNGAYAFIY